MPARTFKSLLIACIVALLFFSVPISSWARGGGGCVAQGTLVSTPDGSVALGELKKGNTVWSVAEGKLVKARVRALTKVIPEEYLEVSTPATRVEITSEHPIMVARGEYRAAGLLRAGDTVYLAGKDRLEPSVVESVRRIPAERPAFNLLVSPGGTFIAGGFVVHNKGCFLPDSPILKADGTECAISAIKPGEELLAFTPEGRMVRTKVREIMGYEVDGYILLKTERVTLRVTEEHPFYVGRGTFKTIEAIGEGDSLFAWDGSWFSEQRIISLERVRDRVKVFNLWTDQPNTFFAGRIAVHNKGGCFPAGTKIATPAGPAAIETLSAGDEVLGITGDAVTVRTSVRSIFISKSPLLRVETDRGALLATEEHPVSFWEGGFGAVGDLRRGERVVKWKAGRLVPGKVRHVFDGAGEGLVFNLQVGEPHTFVAEGIVVHNKGGGCFPKGTPVRTPWGQIAIERLSRGDPVLAVDPEGEIVASQVEQIYATRSLAFWVETELGILRTTQDHPVGVRNGGFVPAGELRPGQKVLMWINGHIRDATVRKASLGGCEEEVYNLSVGWPNTFLASDFVAHNKGGGSFHSGSRSSGGGGSSSDGGMAALIVTMVSIAGILLLIFVLSRRRGRSRSENLDYVYSQSKVAPKREKTEKLLAFLGKQDPAVAPEALRKLVDSTFRKLQECWQAREYGPMQSCLMPDLYAQHIAQLQGLLRNHEVNRIEGLKVERVELVNIRYTEKMDQREFTALISAWARDFYVDDRTGKFLRGDEAPARFQEFWTFRRVGDRWLLREIGQAGESDLLKEENFVAMLTDDTIKGIYGEGVAKKEGAAGPWLEKETEAKATRIERMLNFLVQTDKLWDRNGMLERARQVFLSVYLARESGEVAAAPIQDLFPEVAGSLKEQIQHWRSEGQTVEYRNLCVRKVELILVRNFADRTRDEFTVRISAHAQRIARKGGQIVSEQQYVTPFEEYWTFGRLDEQWKLKEVLAPAIGKRRITEENVDEDSSSGQLQWYYRQTRAV